MWKENVIFIIFHIHKWSCLCQIDYGLYTQHNNVYNNWPAKKYLTEGFYVLHSFTLIVKL